MHRHGFSTRKLGRKRDQRRALLRNLATSLVEYESIETTLPKAKEVLPYMEKLITKAKKNTLHSRRQVISKLDTVSASHKLLDDIAPKLTGRTSGHLRVERTRLRRGDNAQMARVSFVDDLSAVLTKPAKSEPAKAPKKVAAKKPAVKPVKKATIATKKEATEKNDV